MNGPYAAGPGVVYLRIEPGSYTPDQARKLAKDIADLAVIADGPLMALMLKPGDPASAPVVPFAEAKKRRGKGAAADG